MSPISCFKAYDVRGTVPATLNPAVARAVGRAYCAVLGTKNVAVGYDARLSGPALQDALALGLREGGAKVTSIGMCGTEEIYHAAFACAYDGGIMVTGSHNPKDDNGMKFVKAGAVPVSGDTGLNDIRDRAEAELQILLDAGLASAAGETDMTRALPLGKTRPAALADAGLPPLCTADHRDAYIARLLSLTGGTGGLRPLKIHVDPGNGCAGLVLKKLAAQLPYEFTFANMEPDGTFPNGVPNPLLPERRDATARAVRENGADMGVAWDGDFDRCFFYDANGNFIEGYYMVGVLAQALLALNPGEKIIHDPRLVWNTQSVVSAAGGTPVQSKTGHAFIKERMRAENALYGGEMSAHHYFRDFACCDSGMLPFLLTARLVCEKGTALRELVAERMAAFPCSGEINSRVADARAVMARVGDAYAAAALEEDSTDGLSLAFEGWRFNLRMSNTEPLLRLNVESRGDTQLMQQKTQELLALIRG